MSEFHRGKLTPEIQELAVEFLGREITTEELRLYPYIDFVSKNSQPVVWEKINDVEYGILVQLFEEQHIYIEEKPDKNGKYDGLIVYLSKEFYNFMSNVLYLGYVKYKFDKVNGELSG